MISEEMIRKTVDKVAREKTPLSDIEMMFQPITMGELMIRLFGVNKYESILSDASVGRSSAGLIDYAYSVIDRELIYLAIKRRLQLTDTCN